MHEPDRNSRILIPLLFILVFGAYLGFQRLHVHLTGSLPSNTLAISLGLILGSGTAWILVRQRR